jgi:hypothetical protein
VAAVLCCSSVAVAQGGPPVPDVTGYQRALYPNGLPQRENPLSESKVQTEFSLEARAVLPNTARQVIVYSERITKDVYSDNVYWVFLAVVEKSGDSVRVLDQREVTGDLKLFTEFPGNFLRLGALATIFQARNATVASFELSTTLAGTGGLTQAGHFFYVVSPRGKLEPALALESTYESGRSGPEGNSTVLSIRVGVSPQVAGDLVLTTRDAEWDAYEPATKAKCGPVTSTRYRFNGSRYEQASASLPDTGGARFRPLPLLFRQATCAN